MTITKETIGEKIKEIYIKLKNDNGDITEEQRQVLLEKLMQLEEQSEEQCEEQYEELDFDTQLHSELLSQDDTFIEYESIYFKYWFEGCENINDILERLNDLKQQFEQWKIEGHELTQPVDNGYCFIDKVSDF
jgi:hypothetical protein